MCFLFTPLDAAHRYTITVDDALASMTVEAHFEQPVDRITARSKNAARHLRSARDCDTGAALTARDRYLQLPHGEISCLRYTVDLRAAADPGMNFDPATVVASPTLWMWRPQLRRNDEILARFVLPAGTDVFVPWQALPDGNGYRLTATPQSGTATAVFGAVDKHVERLAQTELTIVVLKSTTQPDRPALIEWVRNSVASVALAYGRFPNPGTSVVLMTPESAPWPGERAVPFGRVVRDGGETIELLINPQKPLSDFYDDWTPVHEFSHLLLPYLDRRQRWISEGFAQYYQNVLLARAGQYSAERAWKNIHDGLERGRQSAPGLSPNAAAGGEQRDTRMKVYWSGAALALMADVELRRRSAGRESLDSALEGLQRCCLPSAYAWSGKELFARLDAQLAEPVFLPLYERYADTQGFPDARPLLQRLGVTLVDGQATFDETAELAAIRAAITH